ncbi:spondin domain-containing protein [Hymenobacter properus]|uniref:Spondin domain-containing protein n=1 Tax=Hymenobacter properus TaxID=2791026 RepID=A0A931FK58_9BACT|nr:spondin domain-containing protein [Hymenobacter properus]MBF9143637.1 spondin domain-containing protein [Hymenobacter properus]MBR7722450.1 spondin domain-containing protein [Microvirga sp. SRT04]
MPRSLHPLLLVVGLAACSKAPDTGEILPVPMPEPALYRVTFEATWSAGTHANFPAGAHFSNVIGASHAADGLLFRPGQAASLGIKDMAERGNNTALRAEIAALQRSGVAFRLLEAPYFYSPGMVADTIRLDAAHPRLSLVTMIAPSPDWFVALEAENLLDAKGQWVAQRRVPARAYDAGTDSGPTFTAPDQPTLPAGVVAPLQLPPAQGTAPDGPPLGTWLLERIK